MRVAIYGLGYVGLTGAICLASEGHEVVGVDTSEPWAKASWAARR